MPKSVLHLLLRFFGVFSHRLSTYYLLGIATPIGQHTRRLLLLGTIYFSLPFISSIGSFRSLTLGRQPYDAQGIFYSLTLNALYIDSTFISFSTFLRTSGPRLFDSFKSIAAYCANNST